jgi:hypothetical protein
VLAIGNICPLLGNATQNAQLASKLPCVQVIGFCGTLPQNFTPFAQCSQLRHLLFQNLLITGEEPFQGLFPSSVSTMQFWNCEQVSDLGCRNLVSHCPRLQEVSLRYTTEACDENFVDTLVECPKNRENTEPKPESKKE